MHHSGSSGAGQVRERSQHVHACGVTGLEAGEVKLVGALPGSGGRSSHEMVGGKQRERVCRIDQGGHERSVAGNLFGLGEGTGGTVLHRNRELAVPETRVDGIGEVRLEVVLHGDGKDVRERRRTHTLALRRLTGDNHAVEGIVPGGEGGGASAREARGQGAGRRVDQDLGADDLASAAVRHHDAGEASVGVLHDVADKRAGEVRDVGLEHRAVEGSLDVERGGAGGEGIRVLDGGEDAQFRQELAGIAFALHALDAHIAAVGGDLRGEHALAAGDAGLGGDRRRPGPAVRAGGDFDDPGGESVAFLPQLTVGGILAIVGVKADAGDLLHPAEIGRDGDVAVELHAVALGAPLLPVIEEDALGIGVDLVGLLVHGIDVGESPAVRLRGIEELAEERRALIVRGIAHDTQRACHVLAEIGTRGDQEDVRPRLLRGKRRGNGRGRAADDHDIRVADNRNFRRAGTQTERHRGPNETINLLHGLSLPKKRRRWGSEQAYRRQRKWDFS